MSLPSLASQLTQMLAPFLPMLTAAGGGLKDGFLKKAGGDIYDFVKNQVWNRLKPKVEGNPEANFAARQLARSPQSSDFQASFREVLTEILESDPQLAADLAAILTPETVQRVIAEGESLIARSSQEAEGEGKTKQEMEARDKSVIIDVHQKKK
ncbi:MAG TPA: hypothetical protein VME43_24960 [Bryobacteraceae bacterium]|nr:hypothetical protein [Bryobacteraceae bacterium]